MWDRSKPHKNHPHFQFKEWPGNFLCYLAACLWILLWHNQWAGSSGTKANIVHIMNSRWGFWGLKRNLLTTTADWIGQKEDMQEIGAGAPKALQQHHKGLCSGSGWIKQGQQGSCLDLTNPGRVMDPNRKYCLESQKRQESLNRALHWGTQKVYWQEASTDDSLNTTQ